MKCSFLFIAVTFVALLSSCVSSKPPGALWTPNTTPLHEGDPIPWERIMDGSKVTLWDTVRSGQSEAYRDGGEICLRWIEPESIKDPKVLSWNMIVRETGMTLWDSILADRFYPVWSKGKVVLRLRTQKVASGR